MPYGKISALWSLLPLFWPADSQHKGGIMKVMVADGEYMSRHIITQLFSQNALEAVYANTEDEAWKLLNSHDPPQILILDAKMANFNALEICRKIRAARAARYIYIILVVPQSNLANLLPALDAGADEFITKPLNRDELWARVRVARRLVEKENQLTNIIQAWLAMIDNLPFGVACLGKNDQFLRVNKVFVELLGHEMKEILGKNLLSSTLRRNADLARVRDGIRRNQPFDWIEMEVYHKDGSKRTLVVWGRPINAGEMVFQIVTATE